MATQPERGKAVVWYHEDSEGASDPLAWHAGCFVVGSGARWAMQKFKEHPREPERNGHLREGLQAHRLAMQQPIEH